MFEICKMSSARVTAQIVTKKGEPNVLKRRARNGTRLPITLFTGWRRVVDWNKFHSVLATPRREN